MNTILALIAGYFGLLAVLSLIAGPYRIRMRALAHDLVRDHPDDMLAHDFCSSLLATAFSVRAAPIRLFIFMAALLVPGDVLTRDCEEIEHEHEAFFTDVRVHELVDAFHVSIAASNPIFGLLMYAAKGAFRLKAVIYFKGKRSKQRQLTDSIGLKLYA
jgi:hypothetical protein